MIDFEYEVNQYGQSLSPRSKDKARAVFNELLKQGRSYEWLYYAIKRLNGRSILDYPRLLYFREFQSEVDENMAEAREEARKHEEWKAHICAGIEKQIKQGEKAKVVVIHRQRVPKENKRMIDISTIAEMDDESDGGTPPSPPPTMERKIEKTDSIEELLRRVRGY
ncbi:MAG: hypothetical protein IJ299_01040 [Oscillospiraceae bacterium]|nr:hypothetical protein [Oscillospiraceae bacterium]